jgi:hypothetical protein
MEELLVPVEEHSVSRQAGMCVHGQLEEEAQLNQDSQTPQVRDVPRMSQTGSHSTVKTLEGPRHGG